MRWIPNSLLVLALLAAAHTGAQQARGKAKESNGAAKKPAKVFLPQAYIGNSEYSGGPIKRDVLRDLLLQGISARDSAGNKYKVVSFEFGYAERVLYEDSASNPLVVVDMMTEFCLGDTMSPGVASAVKYRIKPGDTVYISRVSVQRHDQEAASRGMKFIVTR